MKNYKHFELPSDIKKNINHLKKSDPSKLVEKGRKKAIELSNYTLKSTKAYKRFLEKNDFKDRKINERNFEKLPLTSKDEYLKKAVYEDLFPKGEIKNVTTISSSSGSTGEPFYFPRGENQDQQYEYVAEVFMRNQFEIDNQTTLAINGFGLGIWIGGIYTYKNINKLSQKGYEIAMAPVGVIKDLYLKTIQKQSHLFDQIILMGYPPFVKDILDEAKDSGIDFKKHKVKIMTATETFSEGFRDYLVEKAGIKDPLKDIINIYGSVEMGTMSHETALSVLIRRIATKNKDVYKAIFGDANLLPTLVQYYPNIVYFEQLGDEVVATGMGSSFPLIRYKFHDRGGVIYFDEMINRLKSVGIDILKEAKRAGIIDTVLKLPFVYVYERSDFVILIKGANVYPENIKMALQSNELKNMVSGRFTMYKDQDEAFDDYLKIHVELTKKQKSNSKSRLLIEDCIMKFLCKDNTEFKYTQQYSNKKLLKVVLHKYEDPEYFSREVIKHKWVKK